MRMALAAAVVTACSGSPAFAEPLLKGLKIRQVDRAYEKAAAAAGVTVAIGRPECGPGMPGFFCSYDVAPGLRFNAGAPTLRSDIDSLEVESTKHEASEELRTLLALTIAVFEPEMPPARRALLLQKLIDAVPGGERTVEGDRVDFTFFHFGYGLVFAVKTHAG